MLNKFWITSEDKHRSFRLSILLLLVAGSIQLQVEVRASDMEKIEPSLQEELDANPADSYIVWADFSDRPAFDNDPEDALPPVDTSYVETVSSISGVKPHPLRVSLSGI